jgi:hypothetical protein
VVKRADWNSAEYAPFEPFVVNVPMNRSRPAAVAVQVTLVPPASRTDAVLATVLVCDMCTESSRSDKRGIEQHGANERAFARFGARRRRRPTRQSLAAAAAIVWYTQPCLHLRVPAARLRVYLNVIVCILV